MTMTSTDPRDRSADEIEREVDQERKRVADTIEALQSKLSARHVFDEMSSAVYEHGAEVSRNIGRQLQDNPVAAIITGIGLAWLMAGSGTRGRADADRDYSHRDGDPSYPRGQFPDPTYSEGSFAERAYSDAGDLGDPAASAYAARAESSEGREPGSDWGSEASEAVFGAGESARGALAGARDTIAEGGRRAWDAGRHAGDAASDAASGAAAATRDAASGARRALAGGGRSVRNAGRRAGDWGSHQAGRLQDRMSAGLEDHPLVLGGIAFAIGAAAGAVLPRTRAEEELVGPHAEEIRRKVGDIAAGEAEKAMAVTAAVVEEGKRMVDEAADAVGSKLPDSDTVRERARDSADRLRQAGEEEAERRRLGDPGASNSS